MYNEKEIYMIFIYFFIFAFPRLKSNFKEIIGIKKKKKNKGKWKLNSKLTCVIGSFRYFLLLASLAKYSGRGGS